MMNSGGNEAQVALHDDEINFQLKSLCCRVTSTRVEMGRNKLRGGVWKVLKCVLSSGNWFLQDAFDLGARDESVLSLMWLTDLI